MINIDFIYKSKVISPFDKSFIVIGIVVTFDWPSILFPYFDQRLHPPSLISTNPPDISQKICCPLVWPFSMPSVLWVFLESFSGCFQSVLVDENQFSIVHCFQNVELYPTQHNWGKFIWLNFGQASFRKTLV